MRNSSHRNRSRPTKDQNRQSDQLQTWKYTGTILQNFVLFAIITVDPSTGDREVENTEHVGDQQGIFWDVAVGDNDIACERDVWFDVDVCWHEVCRLMLALLVFLLFFIPDGVLAATGCAYPRWLNTFAEESAMNDGTTAKYNKTQCAMEALAAEIGTAEAAAFVLSLADDEANESAAITQVAVVNDSSGVFGEPSADKLFIDLDKIIPSYAVASLPTPGTGPKVARITDGDAANSIVIDDGNHWHCLDYYTKGEMNIACPPWNATAAASTNSIALNQVCTDFFAEETDPYKYILIPAGEYALRSAVTCQDDDASGVLTIRGVGRRSRLRFNFSGGSGLRITSTAGQVNKVSIKDLVFYAGPSAVPTNLVLCIGCFQVEGNNVSFENFDAGGWRGGSHVVFSSGLCVSSDSAISTDACFRVVGDDFRVTGYYAENNSDQPAALVAIDGGGAVRNLIVDHNMGTGTVGALVTDISFGASILNVLIDGNVWRNAHYAGITILHASTNTTITNNILSSDDGSEPGIYVTNMDGGLVTGNIIEGFAAAIRSSGNNGVTFRDNVSKASKGHCFTDFAGDSNNLWIDNTVLERCGSGASKVLNFRGTSAGANLFQGFHLGDSPSQKDGLTTTTTGMHATDRIYLYDGVQSVTCSSDPTSVTPYAANIEITETAMGDCTVNLMGGVKGERLRVTLLSTNGGTVAVNNNTIVTSDVQLYQSQNGVWRLVN